MLSNKWTFSLTSLVLILALSLVAPSAMAGEFSVGLSVVTSAMDFANPDVSDEGGNHVEYGTAATFIRINTGGVVQTAAAAPTPDPNTPTARHTAAIALPTLGIDDFQVIAYNHFGGVVTTGAPALTSDGAAVIAPAPIADADGKTFTMQLSQPTSGAAPTADAALTAAHITRVLVLIPKHAVELADPRAQLNDDGTRKADGKSAAASIEIHYVRAEPADEAGDPTVYSIRRAADPLLPVTAATENVIIVLSEKPKEFKKGNIRCHKRDTRRSCCFSGDS